MRFTVAVYMALRAWWRYTKHLDRCSGCGGFGEIFGGVTVPDTSDKDKIFYGGGGE
jgi:hypothetical protein